MRHQKIDPPRTRVSLRKVCYSRRAVQAWLADRRQIEYLPLFGRDKKDNNPKSELYRIEKNVPCLTGATGGGPVEDFVIAEGI